MPTLVLLLLASVSCSSFQTMPDGGGDNNTGTGGSSARTDGGDASAHPPADGPNGDSVDSSSGAADANDGCPLAGCPLSIQGAHLRLWLTADVGVNCDTTTNPERVTFWLDQSGQNRHATPARDGSVPTVAPARGR